MTKQRILVVGDDTGLRATLARWLIAAGYSVELAESAKRAREVLANERIGLAILASERSDGGDFARELRAAVDRLILVTAPADGASLPTGHAVRADGYLARPLREDDVLAGIDAALRTQADAEPTPDVLRFAGYTVDAAGRSCLDANGRAVSLTRAELALLLSLARRPGRVVSRDELTRAVAGRGAERGDRSVDVLISRLRRKIEADPKSPQIILTVPRVGYRLIAKPQSATRTGPASNPAAEATTTDAAATGPRWSRQRPERCQIRRNPNRASGPKRWRVSPVSRTSF
jgi:two-component system OmpR family response regulator